jgi:Caspase domain
MVRLLVLIGFALISLSDTPAAASRRVALVVGAGGYAHAPALAHTLDDAREVAAALARLEFDVDLVLNPDRAALENAVRKLGQRSRGADASLFYFSGHALEAQRVNWLLPVSADVKSDDDLRFEALDLAAVLEQIESKAHVSLLFLDACREDPFRQRFGMARGATRAGLAPINASASGTYIVFATAPGMTAEDGSGPHSPFTAALLRYIETPGLEVRQMTSKVRGDVEEQTDGKQIPWDSSSLLGDFYFDPKTTGERVIRAINGASPQVDLDALFWESVRNSKNPKDFSAYLLKFPQGVFAEIARNRLAELNALPPAPAGAPANPGLVNALATLAKSLDQKIRDDAAAGYQAGKPHKAIAANPLNGGISWVSGEDSEQSAEDAVLERCEVGHDGPCVLVAIDETVKYSGGDQVVPRAMPRVHYAGAFDPARIPYLLADVRARPDVVGYLSAPNFKAAAYHPKGRLFVVSGAASQRAAEAQALDACNTDPSRRGQGGPCFLYAASNDVVLPRRTTAPIAAAPADATIVKPPVVPAPRDAMPLHDAIVAQFERSLPSMTAETRALLAKNYETALLHKALAVRPGGGTYRFVAWESVWGAEQATLEGCQVYYGEPCALLASDDTFHAEASGDLRDMPRVRYAGNFAVEQIPAITPAIRGSADVQSYAAAPAAKAMAFHPWGLIYTVTGAANQNDAETRALAACNGDTGRKGQGGPCYLYASANRVVLDKRLRQAMTTSVGPINLPPPPAPGPNTADDAALQNALLQKLSAPSQAAIAVIHEYVRSTFPHRAIAMNGATLVVSPGPVPLLAEVAALERCQVLQGAPCALIGSDREVAPASPAPGSKWAARNMVRAAYTGSYDVSMIPIINDAARNRPDAAGYVLAPIPKAVALNATSGTIVFMTKAKSQQEAESRALATCGAGCFLYAAGNQVVLPQRLTAPRPLGKTISEVLSYMQGSEHGAKNAADYGKLKTHKALVMFSEIGRSFTWGGLSTTNDAELLSLEACGLIYNAPCVAIAADDALLVTDPPGVEHRTTPRLAYHGPYRPDMVPLFASPPNQALEYARMREPKAMAIRPFGPRIAVATGGTLAEAEAQALVQCSVADSPFPCFLYATNQATILPQRRTEAQP